jgi:hypothetical protein
MIDKGSRARKATLDLQIFFRPQGIGRSFPPFFASGGAGEHEGSSVPALIAVVFRNWLGMGGIELGALVEVVGGRIPGQLLLLPHRRPPWRDRSEAVPWRDG